MAESKTIAAALAQGDDRISRELFWSLALVLSVILVSAFAVIHTTHACRELYSRLQELESEQWSLQEDYGRLMLEQTTWSSHHRVEKVARTELGMRSPDFLKYRVVSQ